MFKLIFYDRNKNFQIRTNAKFVPDVGWAMDWNNSYAVIKTVHIFPSSKNLNRFGLFGEDSENVDAIILLEHPDY